MPSPGQRVIPLVPVPVGREQLTARIAGVLADVAQTSSTALVVIHGEAGVGKSTVFARAVADAAAHGSTVLTARPSASDERLAFESLGELVSSRVAETEPGLIALRNQLRRGVNEDDAADAGGGMVAFAFAAVIGRLTDRAPVVIAVDDVQWLDASSAAAVAYAIRRCRNRPVLLLLSRRVPEALPLNDPERLVDDGRFHELVVEPLGMTAIRTILGQRYGLRLTLPTLARLAERSGGNPMFALEMARDLTDQSRPADVDAAAPDLVAAVARRFAHIGPQATRAAAVVALADVPTVALVRVVLGEASVDAVLDEARRAEVLVRNGEMLGLAHPLVASAAMSLLSDDNLVGLHRSMATHASTAFERARHLAASQSIADADVATDVWAGAEQARARGSAVAAAELFEAAIRLLPPADPRHHGWLLRGAEEWQRAGDATRALALIDTIDASTVFEQDGMAGEIVSTRAIARADLVGHRQAASELAEAYGRMTDLADRRIVARYCSRLQLFSDIGEGRRWAEVAIRDAEAAGVQPDLMALLAVQSARVLSAEAVEIEEELAQSSLVHGSTILELLVWTQQDERAISFGVALMEQARRAGHARAIANVAAQLSVVELMQGRVASALDLARENYDIELTIDGQYSQSSALEVAFVEAIAGQAVEIGAAARLPDDAAATQVFVSSARAGSIALIRGDAVAAAEHLGLARETAVRIGLRSVTAHDYVADLVEALVIIGRLDEAQALHAEFVDAAAPFPDSLAAIQTGRTAGMLAAAHGDIESARRWLGAAADEATSRGYPLERGRVLLTLGAIERRSQQWGAARTLLTTAHDVFDSCGAVGWARHVDDELGLVADRRLAR